MNGYYSRVPAAPLPTDRYQPWCPPISEPAARLAIPFFGSCRNNSTPRPGWCNAMPVAKYSMPRGTSSTKFPTPHTALRTLLTSRFGPGPGQLRAPLLAQAMSITQMSQQQGGMQAPSNGREPSCPIAWLASQLLPQRPMPASGQRVKRYRLMAGAMNPGLVCPTRQPHRPRSMRHWWLPPTDSGRCEGTSGAAYPGYSALFLLDSPW